jgi:CHAT domain-containing protein/Tfp pilus assembly protein PilF
MKSPLLCGPRSPRALSLSLAAMLIAAGPHIAAQAEGTNGRSRQEAPPPASDAPLEAGSSLERELSGGGSHTYRLRLDAGHYLSAVVEQKGVDVVVTVFGPDGAKILEVDSPNGANGPEPVVLIAGGAGEYRVEVRALEAGAPAGRYEAKVLELRAATQRDYDVVESDSLLAAARARRDEGKYREVIPYAERALALREKAFGPKHPEVLEALRLLADACAITGDYGKAEPLYERAVAAMTAALGPEHPRTLETFHNLGLLYFNTGEYTKAEPLLERALATGEKVYGPESDDIALFLTSLGALYTKLGEYAKAEPLARLALENREKALGPDHSLVAASINNLADIYASTGEPRKAVPLLERAVAIWEKTEGPEHPNTAFALCGLGEVHMAEGELAKAEPLLQRAHTIWSKAWGPESQMTSYALNNLAQLYHRRGDFAKAETLYKQVLANDERAGGTKGAALPGSLVGLGNLYKTAGDYAKAEPLFRRALAIDEKVLGPGHPNVAADLRRLAELHWAQGDLRQAVALLAHCEEIRERALASNLTAGSEQRKLSYLELFARDADQAVSLSAQRLPSDAGAARLALTTILHRKGRALDTIADSIGAVRRHASPEGQALLDELTRARARLAAVTLGGPGEQAPERYRFMREAIEEQVDRLEESLSASSARLRAQFSPVTVEDVQKAIPPGAVLIEFAVYRPYDPRTPKADLQFGEARYAACVLAGRRELRCVDLGEAAPIDAAVARLRAALRDPARSEVEALSRDLDSRVMQPVRALAGEARRLLVSPDGALNLVPFAALVDEHGRYLVERYAISHLTSGRDLLRLGERAESAQPALILAGPDFEAVIAAAALPQGPERTRAVDLANPSFRPLPGAEEEARAIGRMLPGSVVLTRERATKAALERTIGPWLLHVATHGFFIPVDARASAVPTPARLDNPLLRSGLALAGANRREGGRGDGLLTALEVSGLDLWGTQLVVLSACDTGVGDVRAGEGVYGLRRALVLAGSETQVLSLWDVDDLATRDLMAGFYRALLSGAGRAEALRAVQLEMLSSGRRKHPAYWAGFIISGDWRPLRPAR